jgi:hypothetical protein
MSWLKPSVSDEQLTREASQFSFTSFEKTPRWRIVWLLGLYLVVSVLLFFKGTENLNLVIGRVVVYVPLFYFIYKNIKWSYYAVFTFWTLDKLISLYFYQNPFEIAAWLIGIVIFYRLYLVEKKFGNNI